MRTPDTVESIIKDIRRNVEEIKVAQAIGGDSWIPYRYTGQVSVPISSIRYLIFTQDYPEIPAVVKIGQNLDGTLYSTGWRTQNGVSVFTVRNDNPMTAIDRDYVISSTQTGTVSVASTPPF